MIHLSLCTIVGVPVTQGHSMVELTQMLCAKSVERKFPAREFRTKSVVAAMNFLKVFTETEASMMLHLSAVHPSEDFGSYGPSIGQWMLENFIGWMGRMCHNQSITY